MKRAHYLSARVLSKPGDIEANSTALKALLSCKDPKTEIPITENKGEEPSQPTLLTSFLKKESEINHLFKFLVSNMSPEDKKTILSETEKYVDDHPDFFLRFERDAWAADKKLILTTKGDCFHLTFSIAAYPKKKQVAVALVKQAFSSPKADT